PAPPIGTQHFLSGSGNANSLAAIYSTDPEDGVIAATKSVKISGLSGMNGNELYYNNVKIVSETTIDNFNSSLLSIKYTGTQSTGFSFGFNIADGAGAYAQQAGMYTVSWSAPLSVRFLSFNTTLLNDQILLEWETAEEVNNREFQ